jgi:hypothetical protein
LAKLQHLVHTLLRCEIVPDIYFDTKKQQRDSHPIPGIPCVMKTSDFDTLLDNFGYPCFVELKAVSEISRSYYTLYNWIVANPPRSQEYTGLSNLFIRKVLKSNLDSSLKNLMVLAQGGVLDENGNVVRYPHPPIIYLTQENIQRLLQKLSLPNWKKTIPEVLDEMILDILLKRYKNKTLADFPNPPPNPFSFSRIIQGKKTEIKARRAQQIHKQNMQRAQQGKPPLQQKDHQQQDHQQQDQQQQGQQQQDQG